MKAMPGLGAGGTGSRERGAVLLLVTFSLIVIFGFAALTIDVGRMYIVKSQLQNAADAGALRAALALDGTGQGVRGANGALAKGIEAALNNGYLLTADPLRDNGAGNGHDLTVEVGPLPNGPWTLANAVSPTAGNNFYFARVTAARSGITSFFAGIVGVGTNAASSAAVAGRYHVDIGPLGVCGPHVNGSTNECASVNCGFTPGLTYAVSDLNPIGYASGDKMWLDPANDPACHTDLHPSACTGKSSITINNPTYAAPGTVANIFKSIDSRFGVYDTAGRCNNNDASSPPDVNVKEFYCADSNPAKNCFKKNLDPSTQIVADWTSDTVTHQSANVQSKTFVNNIYTATFDSQGVIWAYTRPEAAPIGGRSATTNYPLSPDSPYSNASGKYFDPPSDNVANKTPGRRVMNMAILACPQSEPPSCRQIPIVAVGKFFLPVRTDAVNDVYVEFVRLIPVGELTSEIKLYR